MEENDDEAERQELRQQKEEEAKKAVLSSPYKEKNKTDCVALLRKAGAKE